MRVLTVLGGALALAITMLSVAANFWYGYAIFAHGWESWLYGGLFACLDAAKAVMPLLAAWSWTARRYAAACAAVLIFLPMVAFSGFTEVTVYMVTKGKTVGEAKADRGAFERAAADLASIDDQLGQAGRARAVGAIRADMEARKVDARWKRSQECTNVTLPDSRDFCTSFHQMESELATARNIDQLRADRVKARAVLDGMDGAKALSSTDAQADLLKRVFSEPDLMLGLFLAFLIEAGSGFLPWIVDQARQQKREEDAPNSGEISKAVAGQLRDLSRKPKAAPRKQRASRKAPAAVVGQVQEWADAALIGRPGGSAAATDAHAAFVADTGSDLSQAAFGTAMAEIGFNKTKRGGKVIYTGVAFKQAVRLAAAN